MEPVIILFKQEISDIENVTYSTWKYVMFISKLTYGTIGLFRDIQKYSKIFSEF